MVRDVVEQVRAHRLTIRCGSSRGGNPQASFETALACDFIPAAPAEVRPGRDGGRADPAMGGLQRLAEHAGSGRAQELVMTGNLYDAATLEP